MVLWTCLACGAAGLLALYGLHRLGLAMEDRGWIYYLRKKPSGGGAGCFVAFQQLIEPRAQHVETVPEQKQSSAEDDSPGRLDPPPLLKVRRPRPGPSGPG